jgi:PAS domain-containing protein
VQRFILQENIRRFKARLVELSETDERRRVARLLAAVERELALLNAGEAGVVGLRATPAAPPEALAAARAAAIARFQEEFAAADQLAALLDPAPGLTYVDVNLTYELSTGVSRAELIGRPLFQLFPDNPDDPAADGVYNVYMSLREAAETVRTHTLPRQRYDVPRGDGVFAERYWRIVNTPLLDAEGRLVLLLNTAEEVTDEVGRTERG